MTSLEQAKARVLEAGARYDASLPRAVHPLWRVGAVAGLGLLAGVVLAGRGRTGRRASRSGSVGRIALAAAPWLASLVLRR